MRAGPVESETMNEEVGKARVEWLLTEVIPELVAGGALGGGALRGLRVDSAEGGKGHWMSNTLFVHVDLEGPRTVHTVVKFPPTNREFADHVKAADLYENEAVVYNQVVPEYRRMLRDHGALDLARELLPDCHLARPDPDRFEFSLVILDDLREAGFEGTRQKTNMDLEHVTAALRAIGRYHGIGFAYQHKHPAEHARLVSLLKDPRYQEEDRDKMECHLVSGAQRAVKSLLLTGSEVPREELEAVLHAFGGTFELMQRLTSSGELRVLCHGDFCGNNMMFRYDERGRPQRALLIDFQTPYYASPSLDLSFFFLINTNTAFRAAHLDECLRIYHDTVAETLTALGVAPLLPLPTLLADFTRNAVYGYVIASFFLPVMFHIETEPFDLEADILLGNRMERGAYLAHLEARGGPRATAALVDIFLELYHRGCFQHLIQQRDSR